MKGVLLTNLLEAYKGLQKEVAELEKVGINIQSLNTAENTIWDLIKFTVGMPDKEELGVFISDKWMDIAFDYCEDKVELDYVIEKLINWNKEL